MSFKEQVKRSCKGVKNSVNEFANNVKVEYRKGQLKNELSELYETLGKVRFAEILDGGTVTEESAKLCEEIARVSSEIKALENKKEDKSRCLTCDKVLSSGLVYCPYCGTKIEED